MTRVAKRAQSVALLTALTCALGVGPAFVHAGPMEDGRKGAPDSTINVPSFLPPGTAYRQDPSSQVAGLLSGELRKGNWRRACSIATDALARAEPSIDALGVFAMCAALRKDEAAVGTAVQRLRENEGASSYYAAMAEGILQLRNGTPQKADAMFRSTEKLRPGDPLAMYFTGEAQHQLKHDSQATASFRDVLKRWPDHAPALASAARLLASTKASAADLKEAVAMSERATMIEPMNLDYWKQLAELYDRTGQRDRAAAVRLQWLSPPTMKK